MSVFTNMTAKSAVLTAFAALCLVAFQACSRRSQGRSVTFRATMRLRNRSQQRERRIHGAQVAGDLNVIVVGWNDTTATVTGVTDSRGNTYTLAVGPTVLSGVASQSIYYAKNIQAAAAGANTVTVAFSRAASFPDIRIAEYSGADPSNPVDVTAAAPATAQPATADRRRRPTQRICSLVPIWCRPRHGAGDQFHHRLLTNPDGDIAEDRMVTSTGSYSATAPVSPSDSGSCRWWPSERRRWVPTRSRRACLVPLRRPPSAAPRSI